MQLLACRSYNQPERRLSGLDRSKGDATASPFHLLVEAPIGRGTKALNPGGAGAKPLPPSAPHAGRPLIMRELACSRLLRVELPRSLDTGRLPGSNQPPLVHWGLKL